MSSDAAASSSELTTGLGGEPVEREVSFDMVKRGVLVAPALIAICALVWGAEGAYSAALAVGLVLVNFALSAAIISYTARISLGLLMGATLFGYLIRLALIALVLVVVKDASWISLPALGAAIIVAHLGLLLWELKYVAITLAHPGLKPSPS